MKKVVKGKKKNEYLKGEGREGFGRGRRGKKMEQKHGISFSKTIKYG